MVIVSKQSTKKGVQCSIVRSTLFTKSNRNIDTDSCADTTNYEWRTSKTNDDFSPMYAANNLTTTLLREGKHGLEREWNSGWKNETAPNDHDEDIGMEENEQKGEENEQKEEELVFAKLITDRQKALPVNSRYLYSSHNIINRERVKRNILPLYRDRQLDELAIKQAKIMASQQCRAHSDLDALMPKLIESGPCRIVGENICRGSSIQFIHKKLMLSPKHAADKRNIFDRRYSLLGIGSAQCIDGVLYVCQIYKG